MDASRAERQTAGGTVWWPPLPDAAGFEHTVVETPGLRSHVATIGEGPPVVMLHGFPQHWWQWRDIAPAIARQGYRVICPDMRGAGWTEADEPGLRHETHMRDLVALLDDLGIERAHVLAHDLGAVSAMHLAYAHPERVRSLVQLSVPPGFMRFDPRMAPAFAHYPRLLVQRRGASLRWLFGPRNAAHPLSEDTLDGYLRATQRPEVARAAREVLRHMIAPEIPWLMGGHYTRMRLHPPTLVAFGRQDRPFAEPTVRRMCRDSDRHADRFELAFVDDAAHFMTDDAPDAVAALALDWFAHA